MNYVPVIGLETHVELKTESKMFCSCSANYFGKAPNTHTCPVCLGLPGALPVPNKKAIEWTILLGLALNCTINKESKFDRKNYFYPDLPKGYQISQYDKPIASGGWLNLKSQNSNLKTTEKKIRITRVHLEEDTGKLLHSNKDTLIDFNRSGVPLVEVVTEPDFDNSTDVKRFLEELHTIIRYLDISDADMEKGSMRMEPNISLRKITNDELRITNKNQKLELPNYKVEVKNINSFNFAKKAIDYELKRQAEILDSGKIPVQETRGYNDKKGITYSQRSKEEAHDYRYFPEPDIPPMEFGNEKLEMINDTLPEFPAAKVERYIKKFGIKYADALIITRDKNMSSYFEEVISKLKTQIAKLHLKSQSLEQLVANAIVNKKISTKLSPDEFAKEIEKLSKPKETDMVMLALSIKKAIDSNPKVVADYKNGKTNAIMYLVG